MWKGLWSGFLRRWLGKGMRPPFDIWYRLGRLTARVFLPTFGSVEVVGQGRVPEGGPLIVAANHQSYADAPLLVYAISRPLFFLAKQGLFKGWGASFAMRMWHAYPVREDGQASDSLRWAKHILSGDRALLVFPEGKRNPGSLGEGVDGLTYLALRSGAPILPVAITGTERAPTLWRIPFHFQRLRVAIGEPFCLPAVEGRVDRRELRAMTARIMTRIAELLPPAYRGCYAESVGVDAEPDAPLEPKEPLVSENGHSPIAGTPPDRREPSATSHTSPG